MDDDLRSFLIGVVLVVGAVGCGIAGALVGGWR